MRTFNFARRSFLEIIRDPLSSIFAVFLPLFLLFIFQQFNIPGETYLLKNFTPGIIVFGFSFITMFTATLVAKDRSTSFLVRLSTSPMRPFEYVLGYTLSVVPLVVIQVIAFFGLALILGLQISLGILWAILLSFPISILFIMLGIFIGSFTNEKSSAGVSSVVVQLVAFTSTLWFSGDMVGKAFGVICKCLPFESAVLIFRNCVMISTDNLLRTSLTLTGYTILTSVFAVLFFKKKMTDVRK